MRDLYDFSNARQNPFARRSDSRVTLHLDTGTLDHFRSMADETRIPLETLIALYLRDCATQNRKLRTSWTSSEEEDG